MYPVILFASHFEILKHGYANHVDVKTASVTFLWYLICWYNESQSIWWNYNIAFMYDEKSKIFPGVVGILNIIRWILSHDIVCCHKTTKVENISVPCSISPLSWFSQFVICCRLELFLHYTAVTGLRQSVFKVIHMSMYVCLSYIINLWWICVCVYSICVNNKQTCF